LAGQTNFIWDIGKMKTENVNYMDLKVKGG